MNLNCYIIDDEPHAIELLKGYIEKTPEMSLSGTSLNPLNALTEILDGPALAITFLDIDMPQLNGLDVAEMIGQNTKIIFTTSFREHAPEAFEKNAVDYLLKPFDYQRFLKSILKVRKSLSAEDNKQVVKPSYFFVKSGTKGNFKKINIAEIRYVENIGNYIYIYAGNEKIPAYLTLADILDKLPGDDFSRIHQSYIVNHHNLLSVEYNQVKIAEGLYLPVGGTYRAEFRKKMQDKILVSKREKQ